MWQGENARGKASGLKNHLNLIKWPILGV